MNVGADVSVGLPVRVRTQTGTENLKEFSGIQCIIHCVKFQKGVSS